MPAVPPQRLVTLQDGAVGKCDPLDIAIMLTVDEPIDPRPRPVGLGSLTPLHLDRPSFPPWQPP